MGEESITELFELTRHLVDIPSVSGEEAEVGRFLASYLESSGYAVELQEVAAGRANVFARTEAPPRVVLSTHMDTVPPHIPSREDESYIHGRGSCDAKGVIAAQIVAAERLRAAGSREIGLLFTVGEEAGFVGARAANYLPAAADCLYLINGEPTGNKLAVGTKGALRLNLITRGRAAHSAYPEQGESAIEKLLGVLAALRAVDWPSDKFFGETTCNVGLISGGTGANVVAAEACAELQIRLVTQATVVKRIIEETVAGMAETEYLFEHDPERLLTLDGFDQTVVRFTTDIPYLRNWGQPLLLGPGSILDAHTAHECVAKRELVEAADLYVRLVHALSARFE